TVGLAVVSIDVPMISTKRVHTFTRDRIMRHVGTWAEVQSVEYSIDGLVSADHLNFHWRSTRIQAVVLIDYGRYVGRGCSRTCVMNRNYECGLAALLFFRPRGHLA